MVITRCAVREAGDREAAIRFRAVAWSRQLAARRCPYRSGTKQILDKDGPAGVRPVGEGAEETAADRHDVPRRPSIAAGHAHADATTCCGSPRCTPAVMPTSSRWRCGAERPSTRRCASSRKIPGNGSADLRERIPNILFQMLLRANNAVGYTNYPDNVVKLFVNESAQAGIDVFRIFDALNWLPNLKLAIEARSQRRARSASRRSATRATFSTSPRTNTLEILRRSRQATRKTRHQPSSAIKDMAGLCKPYAAQKLVRALQARDRHPDPFPHARFRRRADRVAAAGGPGRGRYRRCRHRAAVGHDEPGEPEHPGRVLAFHRARHRAGFRVAA